MPRTKAKKYQAIQELKNIIEPSKPVYTHTKDAWNTQIFAQNQAIILELGCGSGEYTLGLASKYQEKNYIGVDIKGDRLFKGANLAQVLDLQNAVFLRTQIENIAQFFHPNSIQAIWITFPDPQLENKKKQLTSPRFLGIYKTLLAQNGIVYLKTDSLELYFATFETLKNFKIKNLNYTQDLHNSDFLAQQNDIQTHYESKYLALGKKICFMSFEFED